MGTLSSRKFGSKAAALKRSRSSGSNQGGRKPENDSDDHPDHFGGGGGHHAKLPFTGTRIVWHGLVNSDLGFANVYLDGVPIAENLDLYAATRAPTQLLTRSGLSDTFHTLRIEATGDKNPASSGSALVHDYFISAVEP